MPGTNYFSYFPSTQYTSTEGNTKKVVDVFRRAKMRDINTKIKSSVFYKYTIQDGETPEQIADRYYGNTQYYWLILYANNIINVYAQWPKSYQEFERYIISKYGSVEEASNVNNVHHYENSDGDWISEEAWDGTPSLKKSVYDYEYELNEAKREINIVKSEYLRQIINEMNNIFK